MIYNYSQFIKENFYYKTDNVIELFFKSYYDFLIYLKTILESDEYKMDYYLDNIKECFSKFEEGLLHKFSKKDFENLKKEIENIKSQIDTKAYKLTLFDNLLKLEEHCGQSEEDRPKIKTILKSFKDSLNGSLDKIITFVKTKIEKDSNWELVDGLYNTQSVVKGDDFKREKYHLQIEFLKLQEWVKKTKKKLLISFDGRDAAGKGGCIDKITEFLNPRSCRVETFGIPTKEESKDWFKRYESKLPKEGEMVFFDRSWYTRAYVEVPMDYCTDKQYEEFMSSVMGFEDKLKSNGIEYVKVWLSVNQDTQKYRFELRKSNPLKYWKFSENDSKILNRWNDFTGYINKMLKKCNKRSNPWITIDSNDERLSQLEAMKLILNRFNYDNKKHKHLSSGEYIKESVSNDNYIFLDIDGVVIPYDRDSKFDYHKFFNMKEKWSKEAISVLNKVCEEYNCKVVLITSYISDKSFDKIKTRLKQVGFKGNIVDELKYHYGKENRFENVSYYVKQKGISNYVVIDDKRHDVDKDPQIRPHWCNTRSKDGLKKEHLSEIQNYFK